MQTALVPYRPSGGDRHSARRGFADFLRRGGRARPAAFGDRPEFFPSREDIENPKFGSSDPEVARILRVQSRSACATQCAIVTALAFSVLVFVVLAVVVSRVNDSITSINAVIAPHANSIVNSTVTMMDTMGSSVRDVKTITKMTSDLVAKDFGADGAAGMALNSTAMIAQKLAEFMQHPTLKLSLGGDGQ